MQSPSISSIMNDDESKIHYDYHLLTRFIKQIQVLLLIFILW